MTRIAVLDDWQGIAEGAADWSAVRARAELVFFREHLGGADAVVAALAGFDVVVAMRERTRLLADVIVRLPQLKLLSFTGARNAAVDVAACTAQGVVVCNTTTARSSHGTAELTLGLMLAGLRHIALGDADAQIAYSLLDVGFSQAVAVGNEYFAIGHTGIEGAAGVVHEIVIAGDGAATGAEQGGGAGG